MLWLIALRSRSGATTTISAKVLDAFFEDAQAFRIDTVVVG